MCLDLYIGSKLVMFLKLGESTDVSIFSKLMAEWAPFVLTPIYIYMRPPDRGFCYPRFPVHLGYNW